MRLSVAMATYNGAAYIRTQLDSLAAQTRLPDELVITDDCSSDDTAQIVADFAADAPFPVHFHRNEKNLGYAQNFSYAMSLCTGDLIFLCDQDDQWLPDKMNCHLTLAEGNPEQGVFLTDTYLADGELTPNGETKMQRMTQMGLPRNEFVMGCCASIRKRHLDLILPVPMTMVGHDGWIVRFYRQCGLANWHQEPLQLYRLHGSNASDFFINDPETSTLIKRLKTRLSRLLSRLVDDDGMQRECDFYHAFCQRMGDKKGEFIKLLGEDCYNTAYGDATNKEQLLNYRLQLYGQSRLQRISTLIGNKGGDIHAGLSFKSMARDILRARTANTSAVVDDHG